MSETAFWRAITFVLVVLCLWMAAQLPVSFDECEDEYNDATETVQV